MGFQDSVRHAAIALLLSPFRWLVATALVGAASIVVPVALVAVGLGDAGWYLGILLWFVILPACLILLLLDVVRVIRGDFRTK